MIRRSSLRKEQSTLYNSSVLGKGSQTKEKTSKCRWCGKSFIRSGRPIGRYCSPKCYHDKQRKARADATVSKPCMKCGTTVTRYIKGRRNKTTWFCSPECSHAFHVREHASAWRGGSRRGRGSRWTKIAESIRARDSYKCRRCGKTQEENGQRLSVDHIRPWREFSCEEEANDPANLVSLCASCHGKKMKLENRWLNGDGLALQEYRVSLGIDVTGAIDLPLPSSAFRLGPERRVPTAEETAARNNER